MPEPTQDPLAPLIKQWLQSDDPDATLERLCCEHPEQADALRARCAPSLPPEEDAAAPGSVGPYCILDKLGEGGMGTVYLAEQREPVQRRVALKLIKLGMDSKAVVRRFEQERQALSLMDHEGIAKVYDVGTSERGQPYFVMELVKGVPLDAFCDQHRLTLEERLKLMQQVCSAVQHAHQKGVIHRDLKPGNVLVSDLDGRLQVKIIDFGLAKAIGQKLIQESLFTEIGVVMGTPEYMAPEQADPSNLDIDTRADVYSLGVMLYQLLVGELPFSGKELRQAGLLEMQRVLREVEPIRPSTRLAASAERSTTVAEKLRVPVHALKKALQSDLDWVVAKAMEKDRGRRYGSANALAEDLQRFLDFEPLQAGPPSAIYRLQKLLRRHRGAFAAAGAVLAASLVFGSIAYSQWRSAARAAASNLELAEQNEALAVSEGAAKVAVEASLAKFEAKVREFDLLSGVVRHADAQAAASELLRAPAWPSAMAALQRWLAECDELLELRPELQRTVSLLSAEPAAGAAGEPPAVVVTQAATQTFLRDALADLARQLDLLEAGPRAAMARRLAWASQVERLSAAHPNARVTWRAAREAIAASAEYAGCEVVLRDEDVLGLVPLGENPATGYFEFYHLRSAWDGVSDPQALAIPVHREDGSLDAAGDLGVVFVLLPGGRVTLGAQRSDDSGDLYDPQARPDEAPFEVELAPFFLARHELTQAQWARLWEGAEDQRHPSEFAAGSTPGGVTEITSRNPVERVDWVMGRDVLAACGLTLPTEAQWEYGCRGGTRTPFCVRAPDLGRVANLADATAAKAMSWQGESWDDGHVVHAPVGSFAANAFGLHDTHGNVWEWCLDRYGAGPARSGDGLRDDASSQSRVMRGGSFNFPSLAARSALRRSSPSEVQSRACGLRPARALTR